MNIRPHHVVAASSWVARFVQAILQVFMIRLVTQVLGVEDYAVYTLVVALMGWIALADFGIPLSLQNFISEMRAKGVSYTSLVENAFGVVLVVFVILAVILYPVSVFFAPRYLAAFNILEHDKITIFYMSSLVMLVTALTSIIYKIYFSLFKGYISNIVPAVGTIISFCFMYVFSRQYVPANYGAATLYYAILMFLVPQALLPLLLLVWFAIKNKYKVAFNRVVIGRLLSRSVGFWIFSVLAAITLQVDFVVASNLLSAEGIILYATLSKLYLLGFFVYSSVIMALWPVIAEHLHKNEWESALSYIKTYIPIGVSFICLFSLMLGLFHGPVLSVLIKNSVFELDWSVFLCFSIYFVLRVWSDTFAMLLQSINVLKPFWVIVPLQAVLSVVFQVAFANLYGLKGIVIGLSLSFIFTVVWFLPYKVKLHYDSGKWLSG